MGLTLIKVGCCGFPRRPEEYARHFSVVEVQQTFYRRLVAGGGED